MGSGFGSGVGSGFGCGAGAGGTRRKTIFQASRPPSVTSCRAYATFAPGAAGPVRRAQPASWRREGGAEADGGTVSPGAEVKVKTAQQAYLVVAAAAFAGLGAWALIAPATFLPSVGLELVGDGAQAEVRAMYGGLELAVAGLLVREARRPNGLQRAVGAGAAMLGGLGLGRLVGLVVAGGTQGPMAALCGVELVGAALGAWLSRGEQE